MCWCSLNVHRPPKTKMKGFRFAPLPLFLFMERAALAGTPSRLLDELAVLFGGTAKSRRQPAR